MVERGAVLVRRRRVGAERVRHERLDAASRRRVQAREDRLALPRELQQAREGGGVGVVARAELGLEVVRQRVDGVGVLGGRAQVLREPRLVGRGPLGLADARGVGGRAGRRRGARRAAQREADRARAKLDLLGAPEKLRLLRTVCDVDVLTGDMLGSNSPMDVAFFATHTEVERMWQRFALSGNMTNSTWPYGPDSGTCPGQHPSYKLVWFDYELDSDDVGDDLEATLTSTTLSNVAWRDLLDPANPEYAVRVPYVYHDFEWEHCLHYSVEGVDASLMRPGDWIWNKRDDREESRGAIPNAHAHSDLGNVTRVQPNSHSPPAVTDDDYKEAY